MYQLIYDNILHTSITWVISSVSILLQWGIKKWSGMCRTFAGNLKEQLSYRSCGRSPTVIIFLIKECLAPVFVNTLRPRQNGRHFVDDTFNRIFVNENVRISIKLSLKFVPKGPMNNIPALVQIMAWRRPGDEPLSEPVMVSLLTQICVTRPQWVKVVFQLPVSFNYGTRLKISSSPVGEVTGNTTVYLCTNMTLWKSVGEV